MRKTVLFGIIITLVYVIFLVNFNLDKFYQEELRFYLSKNYHLAKFIFFENSSFWNAFIIIPGILLVYKLSNYRNNNYFSVGMFIITFVVSAVCYLGGNEILGDVSIYLYTPLLLKIFYYFFLLIFPGFIMIAFYINHDVSETEYSWREKTYYFFVNLLAIMLIYCLVFGIPNALLLVAISSCSIILQFVFYYTIKLIINVIKNIPEIYKKSINWLNYR